jgi:hypothetical protein
MTQIAQLLLQQPQLRARVGQCLRRGLGVALQTPARRALAFDLERRVLFGRLPVRVGQFEVGA